MLDLNGIGRSDAEVEDAGPLFGPEGQLFGKGRRRHSRSNDRWPFRQQCGKDRMAALKRAPRDRIDQGGQRAGRFHGEIQPS